MFHSEVAKERLQNRRLTSSPSLSGSEALSSGPSQGADDSGRRSAQESAMIQAGIDSDGRPVSRNSFSSSSSSSMIPSSSSSSIPPSSATTSTTTSSSRGKGHLAQFLQGTTMPKYYKIFEIKYSRFGVEDFDFGFYNQTRFGGLETHITHSYCNSLLQSLLFLPSLHSILIRHSRTSCSRDPCLSCELGFLFSMLQDSGGRNCHASNFLRAFSAIPQVSALGLFEPEVPDPSTSYAALVQSLNRFLLEQIHYELTSPSSPSGKGSGKRSSPPSSSSSSSPSPSPSPPSPSGSQGVDPRQSEIQRLFGIPTDQTSRCSTCKHESSRSSLPFSLDLSYTYDSLGSAKLTNGLVEALHAALSRERPGKAWCDACKTYRPTIQKRSVLAPLPPYLVINTTAVQKSDGTGWMGLKRGQSLPWLPTYMTLTVDGPNGAQVKAGKDPSGMGPSAKVYALQSCISQIQPLEEIPHLVSHIHTDDPSSSSSGSTASDEWCLFNDFLVRPIPQEEVTSIDASWRLPALVFYVEVPPSPSSGSSVEADASAKEGTIRMRKEEEDPLLEPSVKSEESPSGKEHEKEGDTKIKRQDVKVKKEGEGKGDPVTSVEGRKRETSKEKRARKAHSRRSSPDLSVLYKEYSVAKYVSSHSFPILPIFHLLISLPPPPPSLSLGTPPERADKRRFLVRSNPLLPMNCNLACWWPSMPSSLP